MMTFAAHASLGITAPLFEADGTVDDDDKQHGLGFYGGILWDDPTQAAATLLQLAGEYRGGFNNGGFSS